ncbi:MAG: hypothetical protein NW201_07885 [Gemmatimonadales bacterium]|nr:hypothetical protein [Gemmatimonadales bacterium]
MFPYELYKVVHLVGIMLAFASVGAVAIYAGTGQAVKGAPTRKFLGIMHGVAMFIVLLGGFGMAARLGLVKGFPGWLWGKIAIWALVAGIVVLPYRRPELSRPAFILGPFLGAIAAYLAVYHPM